MKKYCDGQKKPLLGPLELLTLQLAASGLTRNEIAAKRGVSRRTVNTQLEKVFLKLEVHNVQSAYRRANELELYDPPLTLT